MPESEPNEYIVSYPNITEPVKVGYIRFAARNKTVELLSQDNTCLIFPNESWVTRAPKGLRIVVSSDGTVSPPGYRQNY